MTDWPFAYHEEAMIILHYTAGVVYWNLIGKHWQPFPAATKGNTENYSEQFFWKLFFGDLWDHHKRV